MSKFDIFILKEILPWVNNMNIKKLGPDYKKSRLLNKERNSIVRSKATVIKLLNFIRLRQKIKGTFKEDLIKLSKTTISNFKNIDSSLTGQFGNVKKILEEYNLSDSDENVIIEILQKKCNIK